ncbi:glycosyltransferase [Vulcanisaeta thermophila]|uniref:glycosyltransferase n=1 Tax=Vulcanisaeta thermophila TaxID=867917 RepID=UPI001EE2BD1A|nr:glycosyltransferase [Vulcanisaeta thermophila]
MPSGELTLMELLIIISLLLWLSQYFVSRRVKIYERPALTNEGGISLPRVSIVIPVRKEKASGIEKTLESILLQKYPRNLLDVLIIVDEDDKETLRNAQGVISRFTGLLNIRLVVNHDLRVRLKSSAMNTALRHVTSNIVGFYDADDVFPSDQVLNAVLLMMERGYVAVGTRVYRFRSNVLGRLMYLETMIWYNAVIPFLKVTTGLIPLSGEGLFIRKDVVGSIPHSMAEDSLLSMKLIRQGFKVGLLDSYVYELAPSGLLSFMKQRIRWNKGYAQNLVLMMRQGINPSYLVRLLSFYLIMIIPSALIVVSSLGAMVITYMALINGGGPWTPILQLVIIMVASEFIALYVIRDFIRESMYMLESSILLPIYWLLVGALAVASPLVPIGHWLKTER